MNTPPPLNRPMSGLTTGYCAICNAEVPAHSDGRRRFCANPPSQTPDDGAHFWRAPVSVFRSSEEALQFATELKGRGSRR